MDEAQIEREQIAQVFGLTGGDLHEANPKYPDEWDGKIKYWYNGRPDYATDLGEPEFEDCTHCDGTGYEPGSDDDYCSVCEGAGRFDHEVRTAVLFCLWGVPEAPEGWVQIGMYSSSGEVECMNCGPGTDWDGSRDQKIAEIDNPGGTNTCYQGKPDCPLCEGSGYIYIGDGYAEVVYQTAHRV